MNVPPRTRLPPYSDRPQQARRGAWLLISCAALSFLGTACANEQCLKGLPYPVQRCCGCEPKSRQIEQALAQCHYSDLVVQQSIDCVRVNDVRTCLEQRKQLDPTMSAACRAVIEEAVARAPEPAEEATWQTCYKYHTEGAVEYGLPDVELTYLAALPQSRNDSGDHRWRATSSVALMDWSRMYSIRLNMGAGARTFDRPYLGPNGATFATDYGQVNPEFVLGVSLLDFRVHLAGMLAFSVASIGLGVEFDTRAPVAGRNPQLTFELTMLSLRWAPFEGEFGRHLYLTGAIHSIREAPGIVLYTGSEPPTTGLGDQLYWYGAAGAGYAFY
jgi:hypothetical protein